MRTLYMLRRLVGDSRHARMPRVAATAAAVAAGSAVVAGACTVNVAVTAAGGGSGGGGAGVEKFALGELGSNMYAPLGTLPPAPGEVERAALPLPDPKGRPRVAFQGELGAYSEFAVTMHYGEGNAIPVPCEDFEELVDLVSKGAVERGLIPVENSLAGTIHKNYDILLAHDEIQVVGEVTIPISHCLMALEGTELSDVRRVLSHPVALAQCERYLERLGATPQAAYDTAGSAKLVAQQQLRDAAAIAGQGAAKRYGLKVLAQGVQDESTNHTRFLELCTSRQAPRPRVGHTARTSLIVGLASRPGSLVHALTILSMRNLDMTKLESRPVNSLSSKTRQLIDASLHSASGGEFPSVFLIDVTGSTADRAMNNAIAHLLEEPIFLRILGSYEL